MASAPSSHKPIRVIVVSSVRPEPSSAGQIILHRHLVDRPEIEWLGFGSEPTRLTASSAIRRAMGRLAQTKWQQFAHDFWAWRDGRWLAGLLPKTIPNDGRTVVLTVAQGDACGAARRFAQKQRLPLVTFFHDWWPDMALVHSLLRKRLENQFYEIYQQSHLALCVSEEMRAKLGAHPTAQVLYPVPAKTPPVSQTASSGIFRVLYFGNLNDYGPIVAKALNELKRHPTIRLEVRGGNPNWPPDFRAEMQRAGRWYDFAPRSELDVWLASASAFLVTMIFDPGLRRRMETSFPSKLPEMAQLGKPLVIWGPEYCSAVQWARKGNRALCITDPNPAALRQALEQLAASPDEQQRLANATREAARTDFNPDRIQAQFVAALQTVVTNSIQPA